MVLACDRALYFPSVVSPELPAECFGCDETARSPKKDGRPCCASEHCDTKYHTAYCLVVFRLDDAHRAVCPIMSRPSAAAALRESFGDRRPPEISRKITACVSCRKLKVR
jgi:hypothetical protein